MQLEITERGLVSGADVGKEGQAREIPVYGLVSGWVMIPWMEKGVLGRGRDEDHGDGHVRFQVLV